MLSIPVVEIVIELLTRMPVFQHFVVSVLRSLIGVDTICSWLTAGSARESYEKNNNDQYKNHPTVCKGPALEPVACT